eukprot:15473873-Alexandrium_andersonii.AAC.1
MLHIGAKCVYRWREAVVHGANLSENGVPLGGGSKTRNIAVCGRVRMVGTGSGGRKSGGVETGRQ